MAFTLPNFNLTCNVFDAGVFVPPPRLTVACNLAWGRRVNVASGPEEGYGFTPNVSMSLLLPKLTDIRSDRNIEGPDLIECPAGSGRLYVVTMVDDIGKGFANEHRCASLRQVQDWPTPIP